MIVNGKELDFKQGITVEKMLEELNISREKVVVEINMEILDRDKFKDRILSKEDKVEIVAFVGGG
ncbi:sulfur carrier protein ThiS [Haloimpatiens massiliensis]|uniref:sulfur carrier protein ThiS n=1 Tax=Haloimpatiens massiliensis TaxID=1658110 RepID=UPI000C83FA5E|nr:sulfur carrier protein ThiS [Haloimpatiens massiliensis]